METWMQKAQKVQKILERAPKFDKELRVEGEEFHRRQQALIAQLEKAGLDCALVYSDEHYIGDVPYLGGCVNVCVEPIAGVLGKNGFHLLAGLEGGYVAEQLSYRSGCGIHKVEMLKLADEEYPIDAERVEDVLVEACGKMPESMGIFTPREVLPLSVFERFESIIGKGRVVDAQEIYYKQKYIKSDREMELTRQAARMCDVMLEGMLAVLEPGMLETEVASWGYLIGRQLGAECFGFDIMVTSGEANRSLIGKALNREIKEGDYVHLGVAPKCDGLTACERCTVIATLDPAAITEDQHFWIDFVEGAYQVGLDAYRRVSREHLPAKLQEQALCDYFKAHEPEVCRRLGKQIDLVRQKPYTGTHNGGYTECQEFYGAITLNSEEPLGEQIVTMLDVAVRGVGNMWNDVVIPGMDYVLVEKTLGKFGERVDVLNELPINLQRYVGRVVD